MIKYVICFLLLLLALGAYLAYSPSHAPSEALQEEFLAEEEEEEVLTDEEYLTNEEWEPLKVTGDAIPWEIFATTTEHESCTQKDEDGYDICLIKPEYGKAIKPFHATKVTLMGYMFPLEQSEKHKNFLIGPYPLSCPFHYHASPTQMVEVFADKGIALSYDPIKLEGVLELRYNEETGVFYYLNNAKKP